MSAKRERARLRWPERIVDAASWLVPRAERARWRREWRAELAHRRSRGERELALARKSLGALLHGVWLAREAWRWHVISQDLRYALRNLVRRPAFVAVAVATLGIGIGANTALFSVVDGVLLRPLPYPEPERLVALFETNETLGEEPRGASPANVLDFRRESETLDAVAAWWVDSTTLLGDGDNAAEEVPSARVTEDFFRGLGVEPLLGRTFTPEEVRGHLPVTVISYELWQRRFGGREDVVGDAIRFRHETRRIVGVLPARFRTPWTLPGEVQLFKPMDLAHEYAHLPAVPRDHRFLRSVARLSKETSLEAADAELDGIAASLGAAFPRTNAGWSVTLVPLREALVGDVRPALVLLLGAVGLVLLLACSNVASLLMVRASGRRLEMAIRTALGASRTRLARQLFLESSLLAALGGLAGIGLATAGTGYLLRLLPPSASGLEPVGLDGRVLVFALAISCCAGLAAGILPAFQSATTQPSDALKGTSGAVSSDRRRQRIRSALVVAEIAVSVVLLAGTALFTKSFGRVLAVEPGFDARGVLVARMRLDRETYGGGGAAPYYTQLLEKLRALPGVTAAGGTTGLPMDELDIDFNRPFWLDGEPRPAGGGAGAQIRMATVGYFEAMRIPLLRGRAFDAHDDASAPPVVLVNETLARQSWPGEEPVGRSVRIDYRGSEASYRVVGVVGDTRFYGHKVPPKPAIYIPHAQNPYLPLNLVLRVDGDPAALAAAVRSAVAELDRAQPVHSLRVLEELASGHLAPDRFATFLLAAFAAIAVVLATVGLYGLVAESVSQRRRELGLRIALGAEASAIARLVVVGGLKLAAAGALLGLTGALVAGRYLGRLLFEVSPLDPASLSIALAVATATVLAACYFPARHAARVDPTTSLRAD